jgi:hypothetical protein
MFSDLSLCQHGLLGAQVMLEVVNATNLPFLAAQYAPPRPERAMCAITGRPAKYRYAAFSDEQNPNQGF